MQRPIPHPSNISRPAPNTSAATSGSESYASHARQPVSTPATHLTGQNGRSSQKGKVNIRFGEASFGPGPRALPSQLGTTPASVSNSQRAADSIHPSRRPFIDTTSTRNAVAQDQNFAHAHPDRVRLLKTPMNHWPTPESGPSQAPKSMPIRSSVPRNSESPSQSDFGRAGQYTPMPSPSSRINHSTARPILDAGSSCRGDIKTPGPTESETQVASSELGTPRLHSKVKDLPPAGAQTSAVQQSSRAAGKQPVRSNVSLINASASSAFRAQTTVQDQGCKCPKRHPGECRPLCNKCSERHIGLCRDLACSTCGKRHKGACWSVCSACNRRHGGVCRVRSSALAKDHSSPKAAAKQDQAPERAERSGKTISSAPPTAFNDMSVETADNEVPQCKHRRKNKDCMSCDCGCGKCHRPDKLCSKQIKDQKKAANKIKDQQEAAKQTRDQKEAVKQTKSQKKASKKRKADDADDYDAEDAGNADEEVNVKVEKSASQSMLLSQPKKKRKKETKTKTKGKREGPVDSKGQWYNPIPVPD